jgi:MarR family 2-MHQ and catechol resistance regulon transcriptional repressor
MGSHFDGSAAEKRALSAFINLTRATNALHNRHSRRITAAGLTASQFGVMETLFHLGPMTQKELGGKQLKTSGNMTMVVNNLERQGFVERRRRSDDRRCMSIHLTRRGRDQLRQFLPGHVAEIVDEMSCLTMKEQNELRRLCRRLGLHQEESDER